MRALVVLLLSCGIPLGLQAQGGAPRLDPLAGRGDTTRTIMTAEDSISLHARTTASKKPYHECSGRAFQTCASGETAARLSLDGTAYGVVINVFDDRRKAEISAFLWRITGRVTLRGMIEDDPAADPADPSGGRGGRKSRRGG